MKVLVKFSFLLSWILTSAKYVDGYEAVFAHHQLLEHTCYKKYKDKKFEAGEKYCNTTLTPHYYQCVPPMLDGERLKVKCTFFYKGWAEVVCNSTRVYPEQIQQIDFNCTHITNEELDQYFKDHNIPTLSEKDFDSMSLIDDHIDIMFKIQEIGNYSSLVICIISLALLIWIYPLQHTRINLHRTLIGTYGLYHGNEILYWELDKYYQDLTLKYMSETDILKPKGLPVLNGLHTVSNYLWLCVSCWLFNQAVFQFAMLYYTFTDNFKFRRYALFAYGFPVLPLAMYIFGMTYISPPIENSLWRRAETHWEYATSIPFMVLLGINFFIMVYLVYVIRSKIKAGRDSQLTKAWQSTRSFIMLLFLLGATNLLYIGVERYGSALEGDIDAKLNRRWYDIIIKVLFSYQACFVCIFHVFVSNDLRKRIKRYIRKQSWFIKLTQTSCFNKLRQHYRRRKTTTKKENTSQTSNQHSSSSGAIVITNTHV